jgi:tetratricopeptide (TPR) repeat protein
MIITPKKSMSLLRDLDPHPAGPTIDNGAGRERAVLLSNRCAALVGLGVVGGEALADARGAVLADPSFLKGYLRLGNVLLDRGDWADAVDALKEGLAVDPTHAQLQAALERAVRSSHG